MVWDCNLATYGIGRLWIDERNSRKREKDLFEICITGGPCRKRPGIGYDSMIRGGFDMIAW